jgi:hypothetical protein
MEGISRKTKEMNIKMTSSATDCGDIKLVEMTQGRVHCRAIVAIVLSLSSITAVDFLTDE